MVLWSNPRRRALERPGRSAAATASEVVQRTSQDLSHHGVLWIGPLELLQTLDPFVHQPVTLLVAPDEQVHSPEGRRQATEVNGGAEQSTNRNRAFESMKRRMSHALAIRPTGFRGG